MGSEFSTLPAGVAVAQASPTKTAERIERAAEPDRVVTIDGLRGVAATLVVLFHLHGAVSRTATDWLWTPLDWIARNGFLGVDIFFVISGFVIALSVSKGAPTFGYLGRFIIRRSIRLDPPYWTSILLEVLLILVSLQLFADLTTAIPTLPQLVAHLFYAQEILGYGSVVPNYWTLCYEIQFYGFFVGLVVLQAKLPEKFRGPGWTAAFSATLFLLSLWTRFWRPEYVPNGVAIDRWFQFFIGALTFGAVTRDDRLKPLILAWAALAASVLASKGAVTQLLPILVSGWLVLCARDPRWGKWFASAPLKFLGAISYSVYLYHATVGWRFVSLVQRALPGQWNPLLAITVYLVAVAFSIAVSAALWWMIERPCLNYCKRIHLPKRNLEKAAPSAGSISSRQVLSPPTPEVV